MASTIKLKNGSGEPLASDLVAGEPALDLTNKRLYTEDSLGAVIEVGTNPTSLTTGDITATGTTTITTADINGGTIDGVTIGGTTPAAGTFTALQANTSLNVDGTVTADGLTVDTNTLHVDATNNRVGIGTTSNRNSTKLDVLGDVTFGANASYYGTLAYNAGAGFLDMTSSDGGFRWFAQSGPTERMRIANNGDISFYEDTGTTAKFFWDASDEELKLTTTSSNSNALSVSDGTYGVDLGTSSTGGIIGTYNANQTLDITTYGTGVLKFNTAATERMRIDSSGRLVFNPASIADNNNSIFSNSNGYMYVEGNTSGLILANNSGADCRIRVEDNNTIQFQTNSSERMRLNSDGSCRWTPDGTTADMTLDASGNLLVGKTTAGGTTAGMAWLGNEYLQLVNTETGATDRCLLINRQSADGTLIEFRKANSQAGNIGTKNSDLFIGTGDTGIRFADSVNSVYPHNTATNEALDATISLGAGGFRFKDLYLSGVNYIGTTATAASLISTAGANGVRLDGPSGGSQSVIAQDGIPLEIHRSTNSTSNLRIIGFYRQGAFCGSITGTPTATSYNTTSDYRLKENVVDMTGAVDRVKALNPSQFNFIADPDTTVDGFLAHEVADVVPEAVTGTKDAMQTEEYEVTPAVLDDDGNVVTEAVMGTREVPDYQGIDQSKLVPLLTGALQEAIARIETLEAEVATLKGN